MWESEPCSDWGGGVTSFPELHGVDDMLQTPQSDGTTYILMALSVLIAVAIIVPISLQSEESDAATYTVTLYNPDGTVLDTLTAVHKIQILREKLTTYDDDGNIMEEYTYPDIIGWLSSDGTSSFEITLSEDQSFYGCATTQQVFEIDSRGHVDDTHLALKNSVAKVDADGRVSFTTDYGGTLTWNVTGQNYLLNADGSLMRELSNDSSMRIDSDVTISKLAPTDESYDLTITAGAGGYFCIGDSKVHHTTETFKAKMFSRIDAYHTTDDDGEKIGVVTFYDENRTLTTITFCGVDGYETGEVRYICRIITNGENAVNGLFDEIPVLRVYSNDELQNAFNSTYYEYEIWVMNGINVSESFTVPPNCMLKFMDGTSTVQKGVEIVVEGALKVREDAYLCTYVKNCISESDTGAISSIDDDGKDHIILNKTKPTEDAEDDESEDQKEDDLVAVAFAACAISAIFVLILFWVTDRKQ